MDQTPRPVVLDYPSPGLTPAGRPPPWAIAVVGPFAGGAMGVVAIFAAVVAGIEGRADWVFAALTAGMFLAWGLAAALLLAVKAWAWFARRRWGVELGARRRWWLAAIAGAADLCLLWAAFSVSAGRPHDLYGLTDGERQLATCGFEGVVHVGWAIALTRRCKPTDVG